MYAENLSALAAKLRAEGLDVRNLGDEGITLWDEESGVFFSASELEENANLVAHRDFAAIVEKRHGSWGRPRVH